MKQTGAKARILAVLEILKDDTDAEHGISLKEIQSQVKERMLLDVLPDRKTIGQDIHALEDMGFRIETDRQRQWFFTSLKSVSLHLLNFT